VKRGGDMHLSVSARAAGDGTSVFYDGHSHPFPEVEGWHAPAGRRTRDPGLLHRTGRSGRHRWWVPQKPWDPADESLAGQPERASADSEVRPGPRPQTLRPHQVKTPQAGPRSEDYLHPPCRIGAHITSDSLVGTDGHNCCSGAAGAGALVLRAGMVRTSHRTRFPPPPCPALAGGV
jgi:hypothetical protein